MSKVRSRLQLLQLPQQQNLQQQPQPLLPQQVQQQPAMVVLLLQTRLALCLLVGQCVLQALTLKM